MEKYRSPFVGLDETPCSSNQLQRMLLRESALERTAAITDRSNARKKHDGRFFGCDELFGGAMEQNIMNDEIHATERRRIFVFQCGHDEKNRFAELVEFSWRVNFELFVDFIF